MYLIKIHFFKNNYKVYYIPIYFLSIIFVSVMVVRFNIINSVHNFINLDSQNQYMYYVLPIVIVLNLSILFNMLVCKNKFNVITITNIYFYFLFYFFIFYFLVNTTIINLLYVFNSFNKNIQQIYLYATMLIIISSITIRKMYNPYIFIVIVYTSLYFNIIVID